MKSGFNYKRKMVQFKNPNHTRIFVIFLTTLGVGTYFSPTLYRAFYLPSKLQRERQLNKEKEEKATSVVGKEKEKTTGQ